MEILLIERQNRFLKDSLWLLRSRHRDVVRGIEKGRLSRSDLVKIDLAAERILQHQEESVRRLQNLKSELAERLGLQRLDAVTPPPLPDPAALDRIQKREGSALKARALDAEADSYAAQARGARTSFIPVFEGFARVVTVDGRRLNETAWGEAGLSLSWEILGGGVRGPQARALMFKEEALRLQSQGLRRSLKLEEAEALRALRDRLSWRARVESLHPRARLVRENEARRYFEGRGNLNDLVEADSVELELERDKDLSALEASLACFRLMALKGLKVNERCEPGPP
jgi:outer membrane protein TolC